MRSGDLPLLAPGLAEADVDDEEDADVEGEGDLRLEIGATAAERSSALTVPFRFDRDRDRDEPADQLGVALVKQERGDVELRRVGVDLDADHVEHADVSDDRQADHDLRAEAEFHVAASARLCDRPRYRDSPGQPRKPSRPTATRT